MKILFGGGHGSPLWSSPTNGSGNRNRTSSWGGNSTSSNSSHGVGVGGRGGKRRTTVRFYGGRDDSGPQDLIVTYFVVDNWLVELTDEERQNVWYSRQELDRFKTEHDNTTKQQLGELCDDTVVNLDLSKDWASRASALVGAELPEDQRHHHRHGRRDIGKSEKSLKGNGKKKSLSSSIQQSPKSSSSALTSKVFSGISNLSFSNGTVRKVPTQSKKGTQSGEKITSSSLNGKNRQRLPVLGPAPVAPSENR